MSYAIKHMTNIFANRHLAKLILREISLMRKLTKMKGNCFTTKLYDVIIPGKSVDDLEKFDEVFLVMNYQKHDLRKMMNKSVDLNE